MLESVEPLEMLESRVLEDAAATENLGAQLAKAAIPPLVIYLQGELGAGKTTLVRGFLRGLGYTGTVKSPTFTLVEEYAFEEKSEFVYHFDLYRLNDPEALEFMGIREYLQDQALVLIEWPEQGEHYLPKPDVILQLESANAARSIKVMFFTERSLGLKKAFEIL